jgi:FkbM family methyltransferase
MAGRAQIRDLLERHRGRWLLAVAGSVLVTWRKKQPVLVTPEGRWWSHCHRKGSFVYAGFLGVTPEDHETAALDTFCYQCRPGPGDVVVDIGAGIGEEALTFSRLVGSAGRVVCVEAHPMTYERLVAAVRLNGLSNVETLHLAVTDRRGTVRIAAGPEASHEANSLTASLESFEVPSDSLDSIYFGHGLEQVDLLKIDIEGAEALAISGMSEALRRSRHVAISCHDFLLEHGASANMATFEVVNSAIELAGFVVERRPDDDKPWNRYYVYGSRPTNQHKR